jgi:hypothetical protein
MEMGPCTSKPLFVAHSSHRWSFLMTPSTTWVR